VDDDRGQVTERPAQRLGEANESSSLGRRNDDSMTEFAPLNLIFDLEVPA
jgi:hypothetical protein